MDVLRTRHYSDYGGDDLQMVVAGDITFFCYGSIVTTIAL